MFDCFRRPKLPRMADRASRHRDWVVGAAAMKVFVEGSVKIGKTR